MLEGYGKQVQALREAATSWRRYLLTGSARESFGSFRDVRADLWVTLEATNCNGAACLASWVTLDGKQPTKSPLTQQTAE